jgi:hypothetical protein
MNDRLVMTSDEFGEGLDRWGTNLEDWPSSPGAAGRSLLASSQQAREQLAEGQRLDRWLADSGDHRATLGLERRILERIGQQDLLQHTVDWFSTTLWRPALAATCMLLLGFAVGLALPEADDVMVDDVSMLAFSATYEEIEDEQQ